MLRHFAAILAALGVKQNHEDEHRTFLTERDDLFIYVWLLASDRSATPEPEEHFQLFGSPGTETVLCFRSRNAHIPALSLFSRALIYITGTLETNGAPMVPQI